MIKKFKYIYIFIVCIMIFSVSSVSSTALIWGIDENITYIYKVDILRDNFDEIVVDYEYGVPSSDIPLYITEGTVISIHVNSLSDSMVRASIIIDEMTVDTYFDNDALLIWPWPFVPLNYDWTFLSDMAEADEDTIFVEADVITLRSFVPDLFDFGLQWDADTGICLSYWAYSYELFLPMGIGASVDIVEPELCMVKIDYVEQQSDEITTTQTIPVIEDIQSIGTTEIIEGIPLWLVLLAFILGLVTMFVYLRSRNRKINLLCHSRQIKMKKKIRKFFKNIKK